MLQAPWPNIIRKPSTGPTTHAPDPTQPSPKNTWWTHPVDRSTPSSAPETSLWLPGISQLPFFSWRNTHRMPARRCDYAQPDILSCCMSSASPRCMCRVVRTTRRCDVRGRVYGLPCRYRYAATVQQKPRNTRLSMLYTSQCFGILPKPVLGCPAACDRICCCSPAYGSSKRTLRPSSLVRPDGAPEPDPAA